MVTWSKCYVQTFERWSSNKITEQNVPGGLFIGLFIASRLHMYEITLKHTFDSLLILTCPQYISDDLFLFKTFFVAEN